MSLWCPVHGSYQLIEDTHAEELLEADGHYGYTVTDLACGHEAVTPPFRIAPLPRTAVPHHYHPPGDPR